MSTVNLSVGATSASDFAAAAPAVEYSQVSYAYSPGGTPAIENITLRVERGERLGILGPNGGGKSTLIKLTLGLLHGHTGSIRVLSQSPRQARAARLIGYVPQRSEAELSFPLSARQVIELTLASAINPLARLSREARAAAMEAIQLVGANEFAERPIGKLSGGQFQRIAIARAIVGRPSLLLLDEPTVGIDVAGQQQFAQLLERLSSTLALTIIVVSHDLRTIAAGCDRVACLSRTLHSHGTPDGLTPAVLAEVFRHDIASIFGDLHVEAHAAATCRDPAHGGGGMNTWQFLTGESAELFWPPLVAGLAVALMCAWLSVLVVLKRLSFIGQGISHAAFGGIGVAAMLGLLAGSDAGLGLSLAQFAVILAFCLGAALVIGYLSRGGSTQADTAIGIILVASMAIGAILLNIAYGRRLVQGVSWESVLFGNLLAVSWADAWIAVAVAAVVMGTLFWFRRPLTLWAFDEKVAASLGIRTRFMHLLLLTLLAVATVTAMKLAGVVLATAMLVLPGAAALALSERSRPVLVGSVLCALLGVAGGLMLSFERDWAPGPCIVLVQCGLYAVARASNRGVRSL